MNASDPTIPAETPELELKSDIAPGAHKLPLVGIFTSHAVPFTSGVGQVPGLQLIGLFHLARKLNDFSRTI